MNFNVSSEKWFSGFEDEAPLRQAGRTGALDETTSPGSTQGGAVGSLLVLFLSMQIADESRFVTVLKSWIVHSPKPTGWTVIHSRQMEKLAAAFRKLLAVKSKRAPTVIHVMFSNTLSVSDACIPTCSSLD